MKMTNNTVLKKWSSSDILQVYVGKESLNPCWHHRHCSIVALLNCDFSTAGISEQEVCTTPNKWCVFDECCQSTCLLSTHLGVALKPTSLPVWTKPPSSTTIVTNSLFLTLIQVLFAFFRQVLPWALDRHDLLQKAMNLPDLVRTSEATTSTAAWVNLRVENYFWHPFSKTGHFSRENKAPVTFHSICAEIQWGEVRTWDHHSGRHSLVLNSECFHR